MSTLAKRGVRQYGQVAAVSEASYANPHRLVQMLMEGALDKISTAKGLMHRGEVAEKGRFISWAISIVGGLQASLDMKSGGEIAQNLNDTYAYIARRLVEANIDNDLAVLDEVASLLVQVKSAWDAIPQDVKSGQVPVAAPY